MMNTSTNSHYTEFESGRHMCGMRDRSSARRGGCTGGGPIVSYTFVVSIATPVGVVPQRRRFRRSWLKPRFSVIERSTNS